jgi:hypothetical protein
MQPFDKKIIELIDILKKTGKIKQKQEFNDTIGIQKQRVYNIQNKPDLHFTSLDIEKIIKTYKVNANWIFGIESEVFIKK